MDTSICLIVGLGNPGPKYDQTRHNAGFWFVDRIAQRYQGAFRVENKFSAELARVVIEGQDVWLLKPQTFMNRSGFAVRQVSNFYKINQQQILVAHDELDLPPGTLRLKKAGGHGGHNGLRDIFSQMGKAFWRLRIGIGHPGHRDDVVDYVLSRIGRSDESLIQQGIEDAQAVLPQVVAGEFEKAMNQLHSRS